MSFQKYAAHAPHIILCGIAWGIYGILSQTTVFEDTSLQEETLLILPPAGKIILALLSGQFISFGTFLTFSFFRQKTHSPGTTKSKENFVRNLYPSLFFFILLGVFTPYIGILHRLARFVLDLGVVFPVIVLCITLKDVLSKLRLTKLFSFLDFISIRRIAFGTTLFAFGIYLFFTLKLIPLNAPAEKRYYLLTGDEPQYLLIAHSLVFDRDFNLHNNYLKEDSKLYFNRTVSGFSGGVELFGPFARGKKLTAKPEYWDGKRYSLFRLGLPLLISPFYYLGSLRDNQIRLTVLVFINFVGALLVWNMFHLGHYFLKRNGAAAENSSPDKKILLATIFFFSLSMPVIFYSPRIYTELLATLFIVFASRKILEGMKGPVEYLLTGVCIGFLPWFHDRYAWFSFVLVLLCLSSGKKMRGARMLAFLLPVVVSSLLLMRYFHLLFGVPYPVSVPPGFSLRSFLHGFPGHIFDINHGLIPYSPFYLFATPGIIFMLRERRKDALSLLLLISGYYVAVSSWNDWWAGFCPPGRYLLPVLALNIPFILSAVRRIKRCAFLYYLLGFLSISLAIFTMFFPERLYRHLHPVIPYARWINLRGVFPKLTNPEITDYALVTVLFSGAGLFLTWILKSTIYSWRKSSAWNKIFYSGVFLFLISLSFLRKDSSVWMNEYDRILLYKKLASGKGKIISADTAKAPHKAYSLIKNAENHIGPLRTEYEAENLIYDKRNRIKDTDERVSIRATAKKTKEGFIIWGPYRKFPEGKYQAGIIMRTENIIDPSLPVAIFDAVSSKGTITHGKKTLYKGDFQNTGTYERILTPLNIRNDLNDLELRIYHTGNADIYIDKIEIGLSHIPEHVKKLLQGVKQG